VTAKKLPQGRPPRPAYRKLNLNLSIDLIQMLDAEVERSGVPRSRLIERTLRKALAPKQG
jgi:hypothetical protein